MTILAEFMACRPVDWSRVEAFLPDRPRQPVDIHAIETQCKLCDTPVWIDPGQQARRRFGPVICFMCAIFAAADAARARRSM